MKKNKKEEKIKTKIILTSHQKQTDEEREWKIWLLCFLKVQKTIEQKKKTNQ
jgi:hypothetical protein